MRVSNFVNFADFGLVKTGSGYDFIALNLFFKDLAFFFSPPFPQHVPPVAADLQSLLLKIRICYPNKSGTTGALNPNIKATIQR